MALALVLSMGAASASAGASLPQVHLPACGPPRMAVDIDISVSGGIATVRATGTSDCLGHDVLTYGLAVYSDYQGPHYDSCIYHEALDVLQDPALDPLDPLTYGVGCRKCVDPCSATMETTFPDADLTSAYFFMYGKHMGCFYLYDRPNGSAWVLTAWDDPSHHWTVDGYDRAHCYRY